jgi:hypothetical protein
MRNNVYTAEEIQVLLNLAGRLVEVAQSDMGMFDTYVVSAKDRRGHEVFEETGGVDASFSMTRETADELKELLEAFEKSKPINIWRPMNEAPQTGAYILVKHNTAEGVEVDKAAWLNTSPSWNKRKNMAWTIAWSYQDEMGDYETIINPIAWTYLPE